EDERRASRHHRGLAVPAVASPHGAAARAIGARLLRRAFPRGSVGTAPGLPAHRTSGLRTPGSARGRLLSTASQSKGPVLRGGFRSRYRCGAAPDSHRIPSCQPQGLATATEGYLLAPGVFCNGSSAPRLAIWRPRATACVALGSTAGGKGQKNVSVEVRARP